MKTKLTLFVAALAVALFGVGCATTEPAFVSDGLVAYYPFNGNAKDESGNGNDGEVKGATLTEDRNGLSDSAFRFAKNEHVLLPVSVLGVGNALTLSIWAKTFNRSQSAGPRLIGSSAAANSAWNTGIHLLFPQNQQTLHWSVASDQTQSFQGEIHATGGRPAFGEWFHALFVYDGERITGYLNGKLVASGEAKGKFRPAGYVVIGGADLPPNKAGDNVWNFDGLLDDARIYHRALSEAEVKALYDLEKPKAK